MTIIEYQTFEWKETILIRLNNKVSCLIVEYCVLNWKVGGLGDRLFWILEYKKPKD